jgi:hypothetical protein
MLVCEGVNLVNLDVQGVIGGGFVIYRVGGSPITISGYGLSADVKDGVLIISYNGNAVYLFSPSQWVTVNFDPNTA